MKKADPSGSARPVCPTAAGRCVIRQAAAYSPVSGVW